MRGSPRDGVKSIEELKEKYVDPKVAWINFGNKDFSHSKPVHSPNDLAQEKPDKV
jgi:hypothetical protein